MKVTEQTTAMQVHEDRCFRKDEKEMRKQNKALISYLFYCWCLSVYRNWRYWYVLVPDREEAGC